MQDKQGNHISFILEGQNPKQALILVHGLSSKKETASLSEISKRLKDKITCLRIDLFAHGGSQGKPEELTPTKALASLEAAYIYLKENRYEEISLLGSSFGGFISIIFASRHSLKKLGLKAPACDFKELFHKDLKSSGIKSWKETDLYTFRPGFDLSFDFIEDANAYDSYELAKSISAETLIVHGAMDEAVPLSQSMRLYNSLKSKKYMEIIKTADHRFTSSDDFERMVSYFAAFFGPAPI